MANKPRRGGLLHHRSLNLADAGERAASGTGTVDEAAYSVWPHYSSWRRPCFAWSWRAFKGNGVARNNRGLPLLPMGGA
jgi:hypothetical protein